MGRKTYTIEKGRYNSKKFMDEMKHFTKDIVQKIKSSEQKYKHDNLTTTECPTCGKFMIKVKLKWTNVSLSGSFMQNEEKYSA